MPIIATIVLAPGSLAPKSPISPSGQSLVHELLQSVKEKLKEEDNGTKQLTVQNRNRVGGGGDAKSEDKLPVSYRF